MTSASWLQLHALYQLASAPANTPAWLMPARLTPEACLLLLDETAPSPAPLSSQCSSCRHLHPHLTQTPNSTRTRTPHRHAPHHPSSCARRARRSHFTRAFTATSATGREGSADATWQGAPCPVTHISRPLPSTSTLCATPTCPCYQLMQEISQYIAVRRSLNSRAVLRILRDSQQTDPASLLRTYR